MTALLGFKEAKKKTRKKTKKRAVLEFLQFIDHFGISANLSSVSLHLVKEKDFRTE